MTNRIWTSILGFWLALTLHTSSALASPIFSGDPFSSTNPYGISPYLNWKTIETEHFRVYFDLKLEPFAQRAANLYEEAHQTLSPIFRWQPRYKVPVVLQDNWDLGNGLTSAVARFGMVLWVTPPDTWMSTNFYDDWFRFLIFHEYTHFLNMDVTYGFYTPLRWIFQDLILPNSVWPPWMLEGLAVYMETQFSKAGRGRSTYYDMVLRAAVEEKVFNSSQFITLDKINGTNPYFPDGDTVYQFGYHLMNRAAKEPNLGLTEMEKGTQPDSGKNTLGVMSYRSGSRIPTFINDNLKNIIHKDWYQLWKEWTQQTETRMNADLARIHSQPTTQFRRLTESSHEISNEVAGTAVSPDGKWIAYSLSSADRRPGLYLRDLTTQQTRRLSDKLFGVGHQFTPNSQTLIYSELNTLDQYHLTSDLKVYHINDGRNYSISHRLRAKDPDVSRDGKWITFSIVEPSLNRLAIAQLIESSETGRIQLGSVEVLGQAIAFDRVSSPKFSPDGNQIYFSVRQNGKVQEDLMVYDRKTKQTHTWVSDGAINHYPTIHPHGDVYFVSNKTGIDNLYRFRGPGILPQLVTNMTTGIRLPCFGPTGTLYANVFSSAGWDLAEVDMAKDHLPELSTSAATVSVPPAPPLSEDSIAKTPQLTYPVSGYSVIPSIWPRIITPLGGIDGNGIAIGAQTLGFDALDLHRYTLAASYSTQIEAFDAYAVYSNRTFGPALSFSGGYLSSVQSVESGTVDYFRQLQFSTSLSHPFPKTYSALVPSVSFNLERTFSYQYQSDSGQTTSQGTGPTAPSIDGSITYSNRETSRLAISSEGGRFSQFALRYYMLSNTPSLKAFVMDEEYIRISKHSVLIPALKAEWVTPPQSNYSLAGAILRGRSTQNILNSFAGDSLSLLSIRGYPSRVFVGRALLAPSLDYRFPISRIFRGWGTNLAFLDNLYGFVFGEGTYLFRTSGSQFLPSVGAGVRLSTEFFHIPMTFSVENHIGFNESQGGVNDLFVQVLVSGLSF